MMKIARVALVLSFLAISPFTAIAELQFRGVPLDQGINRHTSPVMGLDDGWYIDVRDSFGSYSGLEVETEVFSRPLNSNLGGSYADDVRIGFVPPTAEVPLGPLTGSVAQEAGRWMGSESYVLSPDSGGSVRLSGQQGVVCLPWRVTPDLGDDYLIELTAVVAEGESARLAYFGDINTHSPEGGLLESGLGQLVLDVTRGTGISASQLSWTVGWDAQGSSSSVSGLLSNASFDEMALQLGWNENTNEFDAWIGDQRLIFGDMGAPIDVHGVGFELSGIGSRATGFLAAVPEPSSTILAFLGLIAIITGQRRRHSELH